MQRFTWPEMAQYWGRSSAVPVDWERDPDGLARVCHIGAPDWLNAHYAEGQRAVFEILLSGVELRPGMRALDVGCGAGRWSGLLLEWGLVVTGIDIQCDLIERNRRRYPQATFECTSVQALAPDMSFELVTCVTVLQHLPFDEQPRAAKAIRDALLPGGHLVLLENLRDKAPHVFSNTAAGWTRLFHDCGFRVLAFRRYDYNPALRAVNWMRQRWHPGVEQRKSGRRPPVEDHRLTEGSRLGRELRDLGKRSVPMAQRTALTVDARVEPLLIRYSPPLGSVHGGFLLEAR
jgi:SAM-dependent methyltransferase